MYFYTLVRIYSVITSSDVSSTTTVKGRLVEIRHTTCRSPFFPSNRELNDTSEVDVAYLSSTPGERDPEEKFLTGAGRQAAKPAAERQGDRGAGKSARISTLPAAPILIPD